MVGIISAMQEEIEALLQELSNVTKIEKGKRTYYTGTLFNTPVVIAFSRWGKVAAATTTTQLINDYPITELIFTGVAGALKPELNIGDVVIGTRLYQHDMNASPLYPKFVVPLLNEEYFTTTDTKKLMTCAKMFANNFPNFIKTSDARLFSISQPKVYVGAILSGDQFISSTEKIKSLNSEIPNGICVEMEGAAVAQVCFEYNLPFSIIRIISDKANNNATIDFPKFASAVASQYALGIFSYYFQ